jgi:hypothetical protein
MDGLTKGRIPHHAGLNQMPPCRLHRLPDEGLQLVECSRLFRCFRYQQNAASGDGLERIWKGSAMVLRR